MGYIAIGLLLAFGAVCLGLRGWMHYRQTGKSPFLEGGVSGVAAIVGFTGPMLAAAIVDVTGALPRFVDSTAFSAVGALISLTGVAATMWAQLAMGESWRVGIDPEERTALVTTGPYTRVRNPIYTAMFAFTIGLAMVIPNLIAIVGAAAIILVINIVVRVEEEPYLIKVHGDAYREWSQRTGRFLPPLHHA